MLEEPAFRTSDRVAHATAFAALPRRAFATRAATAQEARRVNHGVGAAGENDRHARAEHDAGGVRPGEKRQALGEHVAGFEIGHDQHVGASGDRRIDLLDLRGLEADRVVERERAVQHGARDLPAVRHLAQRGRLQRGGHVRIDRLHRREYRHPHLGHAQVAREVDRVLHDMHLVLRAWARC